MTGSLVTIIGAGMAGLSCAAALARGGVTVRLLDKARGPGGRMSTRRVETPLGEVAFDHGAQYFTARDPAFCDQVMAWADAGVVAPWPVADADAWIGTPAMNAVVRAMAEPQTVEWGVHVDRIETAGGGWEPQAGGRPLGRSDALVLAIPPEQAVPFLALHDFTLARDAMLARSQACWTGMYTFAEPVPGGHDVVRTETIGWAARSNAKPARSGPEGWVVQAVPEWSAANLERDPAEVASLLLAELARALGAPVPEPVTAAAHRWRYAMSAGLGLGALWNPQTRLGVCGDWLLGPRVECAWLSGQDLARRMLADFTA